MALQEIRPIKPGASPENLRITGAVGPRPVRKHSQGDQLAIDSAFHLLECFSVRLLIQRQNGTLLKYRSSGSCLLKKKKQKNPAPVLIHLPLAGRLARHPSLISASGVQPESLWVWGLPLLAYLGTHLL